MPNEARRSGIDLARWFAFVGMVFVNFRIVMGAYGGSPELLQCVDALSGRAAALFVVLAGFGLGRTALRVRRWVIVKRALFLFALGLLNARIFEADILHFYGVYFVCGAAVVGWSRPLLAVAAVLVVVASALMITLLDYDQGWNWEWLTYVDMWTAEGMVRHLFFNGWHPVLPWVAFLLLGVILSRSEWATTRARLLLLVGGVATATVCEFASDWCVANYQPEWGSEMATAMFGSEPIPPMPFYVFAAAGTAVAVLAFALLLADFAPRLCAVLAPAGRQTLTLYIAHIVIGMGVIEAFGWFGVSIEAAVGYSAAFCLVATVFSWWWSRRFQRGAIEALMRRVTG